VIAGVTAQNKVYDAGLSAALTGGSVTALGSDAVSLVTTGATGSFTTKNVGNTKAVTATGYGLSGADALNYTLVQPTGLAANITPASLMIAGVTAQNKVYDTTLSATLTGGSVTGLGSDVVSLVTTGASGSFASKSVGNAKAVTASGYGLSGADALNYTLVQPTGLTANITPASLVIAGVTAQNKVYDAGLSAALTGGSVTALGSDAVILVTTGATGSFANRDVGTAKAITASGYALSGSDALNYTLVQPTGLTANITPASPAAIISVNITPTALSAAPTALGATPTGGSVTGLGSDATSSGTTSSTEASSSTETNNEDDDNAASAGGQPAKPKR
jgi:hypothetical protein